jgi:hypothetical protein
MRRRSSVAPLAMAAAAALWLAAAPAGAVPAGKSFFFATREACAASGFFPRRECDIAFANALTELRARAPTFPSRIDCVLRFSLCERRAAGEGDYAPAMLGVEIVGASSGGVAAPVLAVENPRGMFPGRSIARLYVAPTPDLREEAAPVEIPRADRFTPFRAVQAGGWSPFEALAADDPPPAAEMDWAKHGETPEQRRERLRNAPFIR